MQQDNEDIFKYFSKIKPLSYRQYKRLNDKELEELSMLELLPQERFYTMLLYKKLLKIKSLTFCSKWVRKHWDEYYKWASTQKPRFFNYRTEDLVLEFRFRGFIPIDSYKRRKGYSYILSNRMLDNIQYIYPNKFASNYDKMKKAESLHKAFPRIAMEGFTKILY